MSPPTYRVGGRPRVPFVAGQADEGFITDTNAALEVKKGEWKEQRTLGCLVVLPASGPAFRGPVLGRLWP